MFYASEQKKQSRVTKNLPTANNNNTNSRDINKILLQYKKLIKSSKLPWFSQYLIFGLFKFSWQDDHNKPCFIKLGLLVLEIIDFEIINIIMWHDICWSTKQILIILEFIAKFVYDRKWPQQYVRSFSTYYPSITW